MSDKRCFFNNCNATLADWFNSACKCLGCMGKKQTGCEILQDERKLQIQQIVCQKCKNCICK